MITRRGLFKLLAGAVAAPVVEKAARTYFFAPVGGWESDVVINPLSVRMVRSYGIDGLSALRFDVLYGFARMNPEWTVKIVG